MKEIPSMQTAAKLLTSTRMRLALPFFAAIAGALLWAGVASACPTCKDSLAHDPASASLARGFYYSILFMVSMPFVIFGSLSAYFYWEIRKAQARQLAEAQLAEAQPVETQQAEHHQPKLAL